jgi:putative transcriptional regulator
MTRPHHHLDSSTLISFAAGAMPEALSVVAATHLAVCAQCREHLREADAIGGVLLEQQNDVDSMDTWLATMRQALLERLDEPLSMAAPAERVEAAQGHRSQPGDVLPAPLHPYFGKRYSALRWRWLGPGISFLRATAVQEGSLFMLKIAPGKSMPEHGHGGSELTQILQGAYDDALGHFGTGDLADLDCDVLHRPVTAPGVPCICVAALDAPLRFGGRLARALQPLLGI